MDTSQYEPEKSLISLELENFRGIRTRQKFKFAVPNGSAGSGLNILIGENNSGKSSVIESFKWMHPHRPSNKEQKHQSKYTRIKAEIRSNFHGRIGHQTISLKISNNIYTKYELSDKDGFEIFAMHINSIPAKRNWSANLNVGPKTYNDDALHQLTYGYYKSNYDTDFAKWIKEEFGSLIVCINKDPATKARVTELMRKIIPFEDWDVEIRKGQYFLVYIKNKTRHRFDLLGEGALSLFSICVSLCLYQGFILTIDEPEAHLSPFVQRKLLNVLADESKSTQIIIATHSPYFIDWKYILNGTELIRLSNGIAGQLSELSKESIKKLISDFQKPHLLDIVAKESLFLGRCLIVEGQEDVAYLKKYFESLGAGDSLIEVFGYGAGSANNIIHLLNIAKDLRIKAAVLFDGDKKGVEQFKKCKKQFQKLFLFKVLNAQDIRDKPREESKIKNAKSGVFTKEGLLKAQKKAKFGLLLKQMERYLT